MCGQLTAVRLPNCPLRERQHDPEGQILGSDPTLPLLTESLPSSAVAPSVRYRFGLEHQPCELWLLMHFLLIHPFIQLHPLMAFSLMQDTVDK